MSREYSLKLPEQDEFAECGRANQNLPWTLMFREQYDEIQKQNQTSKASLDIALV